MTEFDKKEILIAQRAKTYIKKLSNGINPIDDTEIEADSVLNDKKVRACFNYIIGVLETYEEALEVVTQTDKRQVHQKKKKFELSNDERMRIPVLDDSLKVSEVVKNINSLIDENSTRRLKSTAVNEWLLRKGFLEIVVGTDGKKHKWPTTEGIGLGIHKEKFFSKTNFPYYSVLFDSRAQQFIADNIDEIIKINNERFQKLKKV